MAKRRTPKRDQGADNSKTRILIIAAITAAVAAAVVVTLRANREDRSKARQQQPAASVPTSPAPPPAEQSTPSSELVTMEVAKAVMVTVELDFGPKMPTIAEALTQIERRYQPDDGQGRTFAILDAYGEPTPDGKLHMSMHVSSEKPGGGQLVFKRTGDVLWRGKINPTSQPVQPKALTMLLDATGTSMTIDGSTNPSSIIEARVKPGDKPVREVWPDGQERDMTFIYSACGCPVHVLVKRAGDRTVRVHDTPVIFPDDPSVVALITRFMRW